MYTNIHIKIQRNYGSITALLGLMFMSSMMSCGQDAQSSGKSQSELINKVNAVQQQMMKQGNISEEERQAILSLASLVRNDEDFVNSEDMKEALQFDAVENVPVYPGCEELTKDALNQCFLEQVNKHVIAEFNKDIARKLGISQSKTVEVFFMIDKNGELSNLKVRDANVSIQAEAGRVIKLLPKMKPGTQNGEPVDVMCSTVITYGG